jgi:ribosomal protein S27E
VTQLAGNCPSCGAPIEFVSPASIQTSCRYCGSIVVRTDVDLRAVGVKSSVPPTVSPIQLGTGGTYRGKRFQVVGRLAYAYERGRWNEWHLAFEDGSTGWLSDAQAEYAVTTLAPAQPLPAATELRPGLDLSLGGQRFTATTITHASYAGTEGELPFERWQPGEMVFADLRGPGDRFATIDYSESPPLLYTGEWVDFDALSPTGLREPEAMKAAARTLNCPNCGGSVTVHAEGLTVNVACQHCGAVLDARTPALEVLQVYQSRLHHKPKIPLGAEGTLLGTRWEVLGFQVRSARVEGIDYPWDEYLLYSPRRGFAYLTEYQGHWNFGQTVRGVPRRIGISGGVGAELDERRFRHFQRAQAETTFVLGEFPWEVRAGDRAMVNDYVDPPFMLSGEEVPGETTFTLSEYISGIEVWTGFGLQGSPPAPRGVYANQPAPSQVRPGRMWATAAAMLALLILLAFVGYAQGGGTVATRQFDFQPGGAEGSQSQVIGPLELHGHTSNVEVDLDAIIDNSWAYFDMVLTDSADHATQFGKEVGYYHGTDEGESWSEGSPRASVRVPSVPAGRYWLRIDPEGEQSYTYEVKVRRDVPMGWMFLVAGLLLLLPPGLATLRIGMFESARWSESDHPDTGWVGSVKSTAQEMMEA